MLLLKWIAFLNCTAILQNIMWGKKSRVRSDHVSPTWNKCVIDFYYNYCMNFNWSKRIAVWDLELPSDMKFKWINHIFIFKKYDNWRTEIEVLCPTEFIFVNYIIVFHWHTYVREVNKYLIFVVFEFKLIFWTKHDSQILYSKHL